MLHKAATFFSGDNKKKTEKGCGKIILKIQTFGTTTIRNATSRAHCCLPNWPEGGGGGWLCCWASQTVKSSCPHRITCPINVVPFSLCDDPVACNCRTGPHFRCISWEKLVGQILFGSHKQWTQEFLLLIHSCPVSSFSLIDSVDLLGSCAFLANVLGKQEENPLVRKTSTLKRGAKSDGKIHPVSP